MMIFEEVRVLSELNGLIAVFCMLALIYAGVVMLYLTKHDGLPPPFPRRFRKFDQGGNGSTEGISRDRDDL